MNLFKHNTDEQTGISYAFHRGYYLPDLTLPKTQNVTIWTNEYNFTKLPQKALQVNLLCLSLNGALHDCFCGINDQAKEMINRIV